MAKKITMIRGDTRNIDVTFVESDGVTPLDLTGGTVFFTVNSSNKPSDDSGAAVQKDVTSHTDATAGESRITLDPADTDSLTPGNFFYDVQFKDTLGNITSHEQGKFVLKADISRRTS